MLSPQKSTVKIFFLDVIRIFLFSRKHGMEIEWIDWMLDFAKTKERAFKNPRQMKNLLIQMFLARIFRRKKMNCEMQNCFTTLSKFDMIVTDTYHLAINGIRNFVPVFCIGYDSVIYGKPALDLHDKKKQVLFEMIGREHAYGIPKIQALENAAFPHKEDFEYITQINKIEKSLLEICSFILGAHHDSN